MKSRQSTAAFTLIELLSVIAIIGILAALVGPSIIHFRKGDLTASATRQLLDDIARARQLAISQRTTVYMVFVPANFWTSPVYPGNFNGLRVNDRMVGTNVAELQLTGYNFATLRSVGEQPGQVRPRYLAEWRSLPEGTFIPSFKFNTFPVAFNQPFVITNGLERFEVHGFNITTNVPFPLADTPGIRPRLPYIAFDHYGRLISEVDGLGNLHDAYIPLAHGSVLPMRNLTTRRPQLNSPPVADTPSAQESPPGNSTNAYNLIFIDHLTGRARPITREIE